MYHPTNADSVVKITTKKKKGKSWFKNSISAQTNVVYIPVFIHVLLVKDIHTTLQL